MKYVEKAWGSETWIVNTERYCGKILRLKKGGQCSLHYHVLKDETFYVLYGRVAFELGDPLLKYTERTCVELGPEQSVRVAPCTPHRFAGIEDSTIFEFSTHHDDADTYRIEPSEGT